MTESRNYSCCNRTPVKNIFTIPGLEVDNAPARVLYVRMEFVLNVIEDSKPLKNLDLRRFSLVFSSPDGDVVIRGCLYGRGEVLTPSIMLGGRRPYDVVTLSPTIKKELQHEFLVRNQPIPAQKRPGVVDRLVSQGFSLIKESDGRQR